MTYDELATVIRSARSSTSGLGGLLAIGYEDNKWPYFATVPRALRKAATLVNTYPAVEIPAMPLLDSGLCPGESFGCLTGIHILIGKLHPRIFLFPDGYKLEYTMVCQDVSTGLEVAHYGFLIEDRIHIRSVSTKFFARLSGGALPSMLAHEHCERIVPPPANPPCVEHELAVEEEALKFLRLHGVPERDYAHFHRIRAATTPAGDSISEMVLHRLANNRRGISKP